MAAVSYLRKPHRLLPRTAETLPLHRSSQQAGNKAKAPTRCDQRVITKGRWLCVNIHTAEAFYS